MSKGKAITKKIIQNRILRLYEDTKTIIISTEPHRDGGLHYHVGVLTTVSRHTAAKELRSVFSEWDGMSFDLTFHKGWAVICWYLTKADKNFDVWGDSRAEILRLARAHKNHRRRDPRPKPKQKSKPDAYRLACQSKKNFLLRTLPKMLFGPLVYTIFFNLGEIMQSVYPLIEKIRDFFFPPEPSTFEKMKKLFFSAGWRIFQALKAFFFGGG